MAVRHMFTVLLAYKPIVVASAVAVVVVFTSKTSYTLTLTQASQKHTNEQNTNSPSPGRTVIELCREERDACLEHVMDTD